MEVRITYWEPYNRGTRPTLKVLTDVKRVYTRYSNYTENDYLTVETNNKMYSFIIDDITKLEIKEKEII